MPREQTEGRRDRKRVQEGEGSGSRMARKEKGLKGEAVMHGELDATKMKRCDIINEQSRN